MGKLRLDKETAKVLETQRVKKEFVESDAWKEVKKKLMQKVVENSSLNRIQFTPGATNEAIARELTARGLAATYVLQWLTEIEGDARQYEANLKLLTDTQEEELYKFFPEKVEGTL